MTATRRFELSSERLLAVRKFLRPALPKKKQQGDASATIRVERGRVQFAIPGAPDEVTALRDARGIVRPIDAACMFLAHAHNAVDQLLQLLGRWGTRVIGIAVGAAVDDLRDRAVAIRLILTRPKRHARNRARIETRRGQGYILQAEA